MFRDSAIFGCSGEWRNWISTFWSSCKMWIFTQYSVIIPRQTPFCFPFTSNSRRDNTCRRKTWNNGETRCASPCFEGARPYWQPGPVYPGESGVLGRVQSPDYPQRQGTRSWARHSDPARVWARSQEAALTGINMVSLSVESCPRCVANLHLNCCFRRRLFAIRNPVESWLSGLLFCTSDDSKATDSLIPE